MSQVANYPLPTTPPPSIMTSDAPSAYLALSLYNPAETKQNLKAIAKFDGSVNRALSRLTKLLSQVYVAKLLSPSPGFTNADAAVTCLCLQKSWKTLGHCHTT